MAKQEIIKNAIVSAGATTLYVIGIAALLQWLPEAFALEERETVLIPAAMLIIFIVSAAVTGALVIGKPLLWYLDGEKKEAVALFTTTLLILALFVVFFISII